MFFFTLNWKSREITIEKAQSGSWWTAAQKTAWKINIHLTGEKRAHPLRPALCCASGIRVKLEGRSKGPNSQCHLEGLLLRGVKLHPTDEQRMFCPGNSTASSLQGYVQNTPVGGFPGGSVGGFPGGSVVKNPSANAVDIGSSPGPARSHMPRSN